MLRMLDVLRHPEHVDAALREARTGKCGFGVAGRDGLQREAHYVVVHDGARFADATEKRRHGRVAELEEKEVRRGPGALVEEARAEIGPEDDRRVVRVVPRPDVRVARGRAEEPGR